MPGCQTGKNQSQERCPPPPQPGGGVLEPLRDALHTVGIVTAKLFSTIQKPFSPSFWGQTETLHCRETCASLHRTSLSLPVCLEPHQ